MARKKYNGNFREEKIKIAPATPPYSYKQILREVNGIEHYCTWTLKLSFFKFGEQVNGEFCKNDSKPVVSLYWSTPTTRSFGKEISSDTIFTKTEFEERMAFFGGEATELGKHFRKFLNLYQKEWDANLLKWCKHHIDRYGIVPRYAEDYIVELAIQDTKFQPLDDFTKEL
jgi:hypothetical protein